QGVSNGKYPLDERQLLPGLCPKDINNDHIVTQMRILDPDGEWKVSKKDSRLMVLRKPYETQGEFYRMYPEGIIRGDIMGFDIPMPKDVNLNRNYPAHWQPEGMQYGACELPLSEPETKAVACFINLHPNIAGVISFHTNAGAIMRPFSNKGDENFVGADLSMYNALGAMGQEDLGYEVMSTYGGFTPDKTRIRGGTLSDWTFEFLGIPSFMLELWNVYDAAGSKRPPNFHFSPKDEDTDLEVLRFADREIGPSAYIDWQPIKHPQLGKVEVGGWNRIYVERNPPESYLQALSEGAASFTIKLAEALPKLVIKDMIVNKLAEKIYKVSAVIKNAGYLPTYLSSQALSVNTASPIRVELTAENIPIKIECGLNPCDIGHLEGRFGRDAEWSHDRAMWKPVERKVEWVIRVEKDGVILRLTASAPRCGAVHQDISI
ncbi:MAG: M14 family zinc carboxypeptidase, partial [Hungatella sp.]